jgi:tRNA dimethylallyltransferase
MKIILLSGPTCSGKTMHSVRLAKAIGAEVVNFDSLLFYRELTIGTAKPTPTERQGVSHHLVDIRSIADPMNASQFALEARPIIEEIHRRGKVVILTGGSGFYVQALLKGMFSSPTTPEHILERSQDLYARAGIEPFRAELQRHDPVSAERYHANDHYRVRRAVEHWWANGTPFSSERDSFTPQQSPWEILHAHLDLPKEDHLKLIQQRARTMIESGLVEEVRTLLQRGFSGKEKPLQAIGYKETLDWLNGRYGTDQKAFEERIVINTRQLAKAQRTWFKKQEKVVFDPRSDGDRLLSTVKKFIDRE